MLALWIQIHQPLIAEKAVVLLKRHSRSTYSIKVLACDLILDLLLEREA